MDSPQIPTSPINSYGAVKSSSSSTKVVDDVTSLTSFNPFSEEDEHDQSSYTLVSSLFTRVKNSLAAPLSNAVAAASGTPAPTPTLPGQTNAIPSDPEVKRIVDKNAGTQNLSPASRLQTESRPRPMKLGSSAGPSLAPPLVTPLVVDSGLREPPTYSVDFEVQSEMDLAQCLRLAFGIQRPELDLARFQLLNSAVLTDNDDRLVGLTITALQRDTDGSSTWTGCLRRQ